MTLLEQGFYFTAGDWELYNPRAGFHSPRVPTPPSLLLAHTHISNVVLIIIQTSSPIFGYIFLGTRLSCSRLVCWRADVCRKLLVARFKIFSNNPKATKYIPASLINIS